MALWVAVPDGWIPGVLMFMEGRLGKLQPCLPFCIILRAGSCVTRAGLELTV